MILFLVLMVFSFFGGVVLGEFQAVQQAETLVNGIYLKRQAYWLAVSALKMADKALLEDDPSFDSLSDRWATPVVISTREGAVEITIEDQERYLNLNILNDQRGQEALGRLLDLTKTTSVTLEELKAWIGLGGFWDRPFPPKRALFDSPYELLVLGMSEKDFYGKSLGTRLYPGVGQLLTTFSNERVNLNTAPLYVLMSLSPKIDRSLAEKLISYRTHNSFKKVEDIIKVEGFDFDILYKLRSLADVRSKYFLIRIKAKVGGQEGLLEVVVRRDKDLPIVYWRFS